MDHHHHQNNDLYKRNRLTYDMSENHAQKSGSGLYSFDPTCGSRLIPFLTLTTQVINW